MTRKEEHMHRYYSTKRPFGPGTFPKKDGRETITNFDVLTYCEEIGRDAWGYIDYPDSLTEAEMEEYELTPPGKPYWCVTSAFHDDGHVTAAITNKIITDKMPESAYRELKRKDIYIDWYASEEEALQAVEDARNG